MKGNIVVGQSGGPTAVINSSVAGVYAAAKALGANKVYGMVHGIEGFLKDKLTDLDDYLSDDMGVEMLKRTPSAFLGSCRFKMPKIEGHEDVYEKVFEIMEKHDMVHLQNISQHHSRRSSETMHHLVQRSLRYASLRSWDAMQAGLQLQQLLQRDLTAKVLMPYI